MVNPLPNLSTSSSASLTLYRTSLCQMHNYSGMVTVRELCIGYTLKARCVTYLYYDPNLNCCYEKMHVNK